MITVESELTVIGAGISGICAAITAARLGVKVALLNDRDVPGGNASSENRIHIDGGAVGNNSYYSRESGIADEIKLTTLYKNPRYNRKKDFHLSDMALLQLILNEKNLSYFANTAAYDCKTENGRISEVYAACTKNGENYCFKSPLFCDASGDGIIAYKAGAEFRFGREARDEFGESLAPEKADDFVMGSCILFNVAHTNTPVKYVKPEFAYDFINDGIIKYFDRPKTGRTLPQNGGDYNGMWWLEYGGENDTIGESKEIDFELKKLIYSYWDYIKNSGKYPDAYDSEITWIAPFAAKRESRRFMGDYILTQKDINEEKHFDDAVSTGGWSLDVHDTGGIYGNDNTSAFGKVDSMYNIPYRIMYSKDISNLFLAGRIISCSHIAFGSLRVMETLGAMAQAAGTAAYLCTKYKIMPRQVCDDISEMQDILQRNGQYIIGRRENCGIAEKATITASSEKLFENTKKDAYISLDKDVYYTIPVQNKRVDKISVWLKNEENCDKNLTAEIFEQSSKTNYIFGNSLKSIPFVLEKKADGFITLPLDYSGESDKIFVKITSCDGVFVAASYTKVTGAPSFYRCNYRPSKSNDGGAMVCDTAVSFCFKDVENAPQRYSAKNIINGYSRPVNQPNVWVSCHDKDEWLNLEFAEKPNIEQVQIYFNPQFENDHFNNPIEQLVTDYTLIIEHNGGTYTQKICGNYLSRNVFNVKLDSVSNIRFEFDKNNGAPEFEVFSVKVF